MKDDGGPAFAFPYKENSSEYGPGGWTAHAGMSLRDFFAAHALIGIISKTRPELVTTDSAYMEETATAGAYAYADAMIKGRAK